MDQLTERKWLIQGTKHHRGESVAKLGTLLQIIRSLLCKKTQRSTTQI